MSDYMELKEAAAKVLAESQWGGVLGEMRPQVAPPRKGHMYIREGQRGGVGAGWDIVRVDARTILALIERVEAAERLKGLHDLKLALITELGAEVEVLQANLAYYETTLYLDGSRTAIKGGSDVATIDPRKVGAIVARLAAADKLIEAQRELPRVVCDGTRPECRCCECRPDQYQEVDVLYDDHKKEDADGKT